MEKMVEATKTPLVTVITSSLNAAEGLKLTIDSMKGQAYGNFEYIVADGGSTDATKDVVEASRGIVTHFISERDRGIYDAWNKALRLARGKYISFIGAGDSFKRDGLSSLVSHAIRYPTAEYVSARVELVGGPVAGKVVGVAWSWDTFRRSMTSAHVGALHSRTLFEKYGLFDPNFKIAGDYEFLLRPGPHLQAIFLDQIVAQMAVGGISQRDIRVLEETRMAKISNGSVSRVSADFDYSVARCKWWLRSGIFAKAL